MPVHFRRRFRPSPGLVSAAVAWVVTVCGGLVLVGWWVGGSDLGRATPRWYRVVPNAALAFVLAGAGLILLRREPVTRCRRIAGEACAAAVLLVGLTTFAEHAFGIDLRIDRALLGDVSPTDPGHSDRMAIQSGLCFAAVGLAILTLDTRLRVVATVSQVLVLLVTQVTTLAVIGYAFGKPAFYGNVASVPNMSIALPTAVLFVLLGNGYLAVRPTRGLAALLLSRGPAGTVSRWLLLAPVVIPIVVVVLNAWAIRVGIYPRDLSGWATMLGFVFVFTLVIWWKASILYRADVERARGEAALKVLNDQLAAANKELEAFSYSVSHDLRAPLRAVDGFSRILLEDFASPLPGEARDLLRDVRANALQMGRLVDDLLAFSRLNRQPVKAGTVDTVDLVRQCLAELEPDYRGRRMTVRVDDLPPCRGDAALLKQVWMNLLGNAVKYTAERSEAHVEVAATTDPATGRVSYSVKDNGVGFDMTYAHKLFGVFQRLHKAEDYPGNGVGLAVVQRIVHRHGGDVRAEARPDAGATFTFTLPADGTPP